MRVMNVESVKCVVCAGPVSEVDICRSGFIACLENNTWRVTVSAVCGACSQASCVLSV